MVKLKRKINLKKTQKSDTIKKNDQIENKK
jgi:hypothetical protein